MGEDVEPECRYACFTDGNPWVTATADERLLTWRDVCSRCFPDGIEMGTAVVYKKYRRGSARSVHRPAAED